MISGDAGVLNTTSAVNARLVAMANAIGRLEVWLRAPGNKKLAFGKNGSARGFCGSKLGVARAMLRASGEIECDIVTAQDPFLLGLVAWGVARQAHVPLQLQVHTDVFSPSYRRVSFGNCARYFLARFLLRRADCVRVVSERIASSLNVAGVTAPIFILPIFIDTEAVEYSKPLDLKRQYPQFSHLILIAARLEKEKNIDELLHVMHKILQDIPNAGLLIAGDGSQRVALEKTAQSIGIADHVVFLGHRSDIFSLYKSVDLVLAATALYEGYGASTVEALVAGAPVVSGDAGVAREAGAIIASQYSMPKIIVRALQSNTAGLLKIKLLTREQWVEQWKAGLCAL